MAHAGVDSLLRPGKISIDIADESVKQVSAIFKRFDVNDDGKISFEELASVFQSVDPDHWNQKNVKELLVAIDTDHDGSIKYEEMLDWILGKDERWDEARQAVKLKGKHCFSPGDVISINRQVHSHREPFEMEIDLSNGGKLGVIIDSPDNKTLLIKSVKEGGLIDEWNKGNADCHMTVGARIIEITATVYTNRFEKSSKGASHVEVYKARENPADMVALLKKQACLKFLVQPCETSNLYARKVAENYEELSTLHEGVRAVVKKVKNRKTGGMYAVKSVFKQKMPKDTFLTEFESMTKLDHPNVLTLQEVFEDFHCIHLVVQLCAGGELLEQVLENDKFNERQSARCMQQVLAAIRYLHSQSICHRDIKADNVLLESECDLDRALLKLIDFGSSRRFEDGQSMKTVAGSVEYMSMEMVGYDGYTSLCDVWSCGVLMYLLLSGYPPFMGDTDGQTLHLIRTRGVAYDGPEWLPVSQDAKKLIIDLLSREASRPTADEAFQNKWIKDLAPTASETKLEDTHGNIRAFSRQHRVKKLARYALAKHLTYDEVEDLRRQFELIDKNNDGSITFHEFKGMVDRHHDKCAEEMRREFEAIDVDGNKRIEYTEFLAAALDQRTLSEEHGCWMAFNVFDRDGSGMISKMELKEILSSSEQCQSLTQTLNLSLTKDAIAQCLAECDADMDGQIDFEEFLAMMRGGDAMQPQLTERTSTMRL